MAELQGRLSKLANRSLSRSLSELTITHDHDHHLLSKALQSETNLYRLPVFLIMSLIHHLSNKTANSQRLLYYVYDPKNFLATA